MSALLKENEAYSDSAVDVWAAALEALRSRGAAYAVSQLERLQPLTYASGVFTLGVADPRKLAEAQAAGKQLPSNHSPLFAPVPDPSLKVGMTAEVTILRAAMPIPAK